MSILNFVMTPVERFGAPLGRLFIALIFVMSGLNKMGSYTNVAGWMEAMGVPGALLPLVIALEVLGGARPSSSAGKHALWRFCWQDSA